MQCLSAGQQAIHLDVLIRASRLLPEKECRLASRVLIRSCQVDDVSTNMGSSSAMIMSATSIDRGDRFPADVIEQAVWLSIRFPLSRRMVEDLLAARGIIVSYESVRCWAETFGRIYASKIRRRAPRRVAPGDSSPSSRDRRSAS